MSRLSEYTTYSMAATATMEDSYLYRYPRDLDTELKSFATSPNVDVYTRESVDANCDLPATETARAVIVIEITSPNGIKNKYIVGGVGDIRTFLDLCSVLLPTAYRMPYLELDCNQEPPLTLEYSYDTQELSVVLERIKDASIPNSNVITTIPKDITKVIIDKLKAILPEYEALVNKIFSAQYNMQ